MDNTKFSGFTLVELVAVMVIAGILAAVAGPRFFNALDFSSRYFYADALNAARYARQFAVTRGCSTQFILTASDFSLTYDSDCDSANGYTAGSPIPHPSDNLNYTVTGAPDNTDAGTIEFDPQGRAWKGGALYTSPADDLNIGDNVLSIYGETGFVQ